MSRSILSKSATGAVYNVTKDSLVMGTEIPYAIYHQSDRVRRTLPQRKIVFISGGPADRSQDSNLSGRREAWLNIMDNYFFNIHYYIK